MRLCLKSCILKNTVVIACSGLVLLSGTCRAGCKRAHKDDTPHGANEIIELDEQEVNDLRGYVFFGDKDRPSKDMVVDVYRFNPNYTYEDVQKATAQNTVAACVTRSDGKFSFPDLEDGRYLLHVGTLDPGGLNEVYAIVRVRSGAPRKKVDIRITPGT
jgi:hypothetical protein